MDVRKLEETAHELVAPGKGILAADESFGTIGKRFEALGIESSEDSRRAYREMLFTTEGIGEYLSGVILFDETIRQEASDGTPMAKVLENAGVIPGIKVDKSTVDLPSPTARSSPRASTAWARGWRSTGSWGRASPSGGR